MGRSEPALLSLAESIADGAAIDWAAVEAQASGEEQAVVRQLRVLSELAGLHRNNMAVEIPPPSGAIRSRQASAAPAIGSWGHLTLLERLGGGTSGDVYRAWDRHLEREVALKLLRAADSIDDLDTSRITHEARLLARVRHTNVITVYGVDSHDGRVGLWMELVRGVTLEQQLAAHGPLSAHEAALVGLDLCRALAAIHAAGLIHRDVKAQNVMREDGGRIVLMDLGTGREAGALGDAAASDLAGTPLYLAPEIFSGAAASDRTDLYSLGILLYHLVTGAFPIKATTIRELHEGHQSGRAVLLRDARADLPTAFVRVVERAIARDPQRRHATAGEFEADLAEGLKAFTASDTDRTRSSRKLAPSQQPAKSARRPRQQLAAVAVALAVLLAVGIGAWSAWRGRPTPAPVFSTVRSIAVLPLLNVSGDPAQEYFADSMTDELIATLGRLGGVNVVSRTSVMRFKGSTKPLPEIARMLHVDAVLESSVLLVPGPAAEGAGAAKRVRINARLIHAGSDTQLWDRTFEAVMSDVLSLQRRVASAVAEGIGLRLAAKESWSQTPVRTNAQAQDEYLQGRYLLNNVSRDNLVAARGHLERAVRIDPDYARAHASLSRCYGSLDIYGLLPRRQAAELAMNAATTAVRLDPSDAESQNVLAGTAFIYDWDWRTAERAYRLAIELNPSYGFARSEYARFLMADNRLDDALQQARRAEEDDPLSAETSGVVALALYYQRKHDDAISARLRALQRDPNSAQQYLGLGRTYAGKRSFAEAIASLERAVALSNGAPFMRAELARTYAEMGRTREADALMASLTAPDIAREALLPAQYQAYIYAARGDKDRAFAWLTRAVDEREPNVLWARVDPRFDSLRGDPRFAAIIRRLSPM